MKRLWLDMGDLGVFVRPAGAHDRWQDHGLGLLRTILKQNNVETDLFSTRSLRSWNELPQRVQGYDLMVMNVRSYTYPFAYQAAKIFKKVNPNGLVITGGMHATVAPDEMETVAEFDRICQGPGENIIVDLLQDPRALPPRRHGGRQQINGGLADDGSHAVAESQPARIPVAARTGMRLGAARRSDDPHLARMSLAMCLLQ